MTTVWSERSLIVSMTEDVAGARAGWAGSVVDVAGVLRAPIGASRIELLDPRLLRRGLVCGRRQEGDHRRVRASVISRRAGEPQLVDPVRGQRSERVRAAVAAGVDVVGRLAVEHARE